MSSDTPLGPATANFRFVDTAVAGASCRNHVMSGSEFRRVLDAIEDPVDCFATYCTFTRALLDYAQSNPSPKTGHPSVARYPGPAHASFVPIDIDAEHDLACAIADTRAVIDHLSSRWHIVKSGLFKVRLAIEEVMTFDADRIRALAELPRRMRRRPFCE